MRSSRAATVAVIVLARRAGGAAELLARTTTWWWIVIPVSLALIAGPVATAILFALISFVALREFLSIIPVRQVDRAAILIAYLAIPLQYWFVTDDWYGMFTIFIPVYVTAAIAFRLVLAGETRGFIRSAGTLQWGLFLTVYNLSHLAFLTVLDVAAPLPAGGAGLLLFALVVVEFNDVAQFVSGRLFGRHAIAPAVSPKKTWEGFLGGLAASAVARRAALAVAHAVRRRRRRTGRRRPRGARLPRRRHRLGGEARPRHQGFRVAPPRPWRHPRPARQPGLRRAGLSPLRPLLLRRLTMATLRRIAAILFFALIVRPGLLLLTGLRAIGRERLPTAGPAVIAANHNSHLDVVALMSLFPLRLLHRIRPVAAADHFLKPGPIGWLARNILAIIPIDRSGQGRGGGARPGRARRSGAATSSSSSPRGRAARRR